MAKRKLPTEDAASDWSNEEKLALLDSLKSQCPEADRLSFTARLGKVDWDSVNVEGRSAEQCHEAWQHLSTRVRKFRILDELIEDAKDMIHNPQKYPKSKGKMKHPDQPTKPLTAYLRFYKDHREQLKAENPTLSNIELTRLVSQRWQTLGPEKQNKYIKKYKKQWAKYQKANAKFLEEHPEFNSNLPKPRPPTPFYIFTQAKIDAFKEKHPEMERVEVQKRMKHKYLNLSPRKKKKWIQKALNAVPEYEEEVRHYQRHHPDFQPPSKKVRLTKEEAELNGDVPESQSSAQKWRRMFPGAPTKPPRTAQELFMKKKSDTLDMGYKDKRKALSEQWNALSQAKRDKYTKKLQKLRTRYTADLLTYKETLTKEELTAFEESLQPRKTSRTQQRATADDNNPSTADGNNNPSAADDNTPPASPHGYPASP